MKTNGQHATSYKVVREQLWSRTIERMDEQEKQEQEQWENLTCTLEDAGLEEKNNHAMCDDGVYRIVRDWLDEPMHECEAVYCMIG